MVVVKNVSIFSLEGGWVSLRIVFLEPLSLSRSLFLSLSPSLSFGILVGWGIGDVGIARRL